MSMAASEATSGGVYYDSGPANSSKVIWIAVAIAAVVIVFLFSRKK